MITKCIVQTHRTELILATAVYTNIGLVDDLILFEVLNKGNSHIVHATATVLMRAKNIIVPYKLKINSPICFCPI